MNIRKLNKQASAPLSIGPFTGTVKVHAYPSTGARDVYLDTEDQATVEYTVSFRSSKEGISGYSINLSAIGTFNVGVYYIMEDAPNDPIRTFTIKPPVNIRLDKDDGAGAIHPVELDISIDPVSGAVDPRKTILYFKVF